MAAATSAKLSATVPPPACHQTQLPESDSESESGVSRAGDCNPEAPAAACRTETSCRDRTTAARMFIPVVPPPLICGSSTDSAVTNQSPKA